ncbi:fatty acid metabolism regulator protein [Paenibacillus sp. J23TS9]|uniref:TetR/AcrR family transcriptional regulator n=1 Tax=Paenibacillus sp. J23TS9 TaxID=2807193 RepID=UPI001B158EAC|nr:TetR/AcrR family transcriptional regulator [Paenibacillus sp. J23TS9]GIP27680.1 fatty acid metabolism regulator protein [Paenibacillus sp. J23TS9]
MGSIHRDKHEAILDAGYTLFGTQGFYETKMSDIAEFAGIAKGTLYLYFNSKEDLFLAVTRRDCDEFLDRLQAGLHRLDTVQEQLECVSAHHLEYYYRCKQHTKLFFMAPNNHAELNEYLKQFMEMYTRMVAAILETVSSEDTMLFAQTYIGMLDRLKMDILYDTNFKEDDLRKRIRFASSLFIHGFMSAKPANEV